MLHSIDPHQLARLISRRLFLLLAQAFGTVTVLTVALILGLFAYAINPRLITSDYVVALPLEGYYAGHGSWAGIETFVTDPTLSIYPFYSADRAWERVVLLDATGRVLMDRGQTTGKRIGQIYPLTAEEVQLPLAVNGQAIGALIVPPVSNLETLRLLGSLLLPVSLIALLLGLLTLIIGLMLMRRFVMPLADVIAAAQSVTAGDLSARVQARGPGDLQSLIDSFNRMADALERNDRERRSLLADIAHELRTPLTIIRGKLEGMVDGVYPADETHVAPVLEETYMLERLVEDLRLLTLAEARQLHFDYKAVDLGDLAQHVADLFEAEAAEKGVTLLVDCSPHLPAVTADPQRVEQVIGNLVSNAVRYVPEQGHITLSVQPTEGGVAVTVSDNGPGVSEADLPKLFDRFWRGEKSRARAAGGAGLGLAIARQLIEAQGGRIHAQQAPGGGLQIIFILK